MKNQGIDLNTDLFVKGFKDALSGAKPAISDQDAQADDEASRPRWPPKSRRRRRRSPRRTRSRKRHFSRENKKKEGVQTLESGLQYKVMKEGSGKKPTLYDTVTVNYRGTLLDGTEFDSSYKRNQPATFPVNGVIPGWTEALQLMKTGSKWQLFIPSKLAYGEAGREASSRRMPCSSSRWSCFP